MKLKVTDIKTKKVWIEENKAHSWSDLCLHIMRRHKDFQLIWSDIEGIALNNNNDGWLMYDECGGCEEIPLEYCIEVFESVPISDLKIKSKKDMKKVENLLNTLDEKYDENVNLNWSLFWSGVNDAINETLNNIKCSEPQILCRHCNKPKGEHHCSDIALWCPKLK